jgi:hypothetical protein
VLTIPVLHKRQKRVVLPSPYVDLYAPDAINLAYIPNKALPQNSVENLIEFSTGRIYGTTTGGVSVTENYAVGPQGNLTAKRLVFPGSSALYEILWTTLASDNYKISCKIKSKSGAGNQSVRLGAFGGTYSTVSVNETAWTDATYTWSGSSTGRIAIHCAVAIDILIDELQLVTGSSLIDISSYVRKGNFSFNGIYLKNSFAISDGYLDASSGKAGGVVTLPAFPFSKIFSECTVFAVIKTTATGDVSDKVIGIDSGANNTFHIGVSNGKAYASPATNYNNVSQHTRINGSGFVVLAARRSSTSASFFINGVEFYTNIAAFSAFSARYFGALSDPLAQTFKFFGCTSNLSIYDAALTDSQVASVTKSLTARHNSGSVDVISNKNIWFAEGDSITASNPTPYFALYFSSERPNHFGKLYATSGAKLAECNTRLSTLQKNIAQCVASGQNPIVSILIGANQLPQLSELIAYWDAVRSAGAKVIACTVLPRSSNPSATPTFISTRHAFNESIRASSSHYDALCDFAADPVMGPDSAASNVSLYSDGVHPTSTGQTNLLNIMQPLVESLSL